MYKPTIGLEIHVELNTRSKMFCSCLNDPNEHYPNVNVCPVCMGHPGTLPVANGEAIKKTIEAGFALNCEVSKRSSFDRKNYFYPDLPKGYQISQFYAPFCKQGFLNIPIVLKSPDQSDSVGFKKVGIKEIHLEEDTGRLSHSPEEDYSSVDFNRAGIPLMELVTKPDLGSAKEASAFAKELQLILRYLGISNADMEKGQMRVEANISVSNKPGVLGTKVEIKNLNSFKAVEGAIGYETERQIALLESRERVVQETRGWNQGKKITISQRSKEMAFDYRYFPEPDLPPLHFSDEFLSEMRSKIPELPQHRRERLKKEYSLLEKESEVFVKNKDLGEYFEKVISELPPGLSQEDLLKMTKLSSNYLITDLMALLNNASISGEDFLITPENFAEFITMIFEGKISSKTAKKVLKEMFGSGADPSNIVEQKGLLQTGNESEIKKVILKVISENKEAVDDFNKGKENASQFLIGKIMAKTKGKANPEITSKILKKLLVLKKEKRANRGEGKER